MKRLTSGSRFNNHPVQLSTRALTPFLEPLVSSSLAETKSPEVTSKKANTAKGRNPPHNDISTISYRLSIREDPCCYSGEVSPIVFLTDRTTEHPRKYCSEESKSNPQLVHSN